MLSYLFRPLALVALAHLTLELCENFMPVLYPLLIDRMALSYTQVGGIALIAGIGGALTQPLFGYLSDRWGPRRMITASVAWAGLMMGLVGFSPNYGAVILLVGLGALGSAAFHPAGAVLAATSSRRRGTSMSIFSVGGNLGTALSPLAMTIGLSWLGLPATWLVIPAAGVVSWLLLRRLGRVETKPPPLEALSRPAQPVQPDRPERISLMALVGLALVIMAVMTRSWFQVTLMTYLPEWLHSQGRTLAAGGQLLSIFLVSISLGSLSGGMLSDRIGRWQVLVLSLGLLGPVHWLFLTSTGLWQVGLAGLAGILTGASFPVGIVMAQEAWPGRVGLASALVMGLGWAPGGLGASLTGLIADRFSLTVGLQSLALPPLLGMGCILAYVVLGSKGLGVRE